MQTLHDDPCKLKIKEIVYPSDIFSDYYLETS